MHKIARPLIALGMSVAAMAAVSPAQAAITLVTGSFIVPNHVNTFEAAGPHGGLNSLIYGPYTQGGVTVERIGNTGAATIFQAIGNYSWYTGTVNPQGELAPGYTTIRAADYGALDAIQFDATTEILTDYSNYPFQYQLLYHDQVVATGEASGLCSSYTKCFHTFGFRGGLFDEVRLQSSTLISAFSPNGAGTDVLVLDNISLHEVPEPKIWAMMLMGFGFVGFAMRKRSHVRTAVTMPILLLDHA